MLSLLGTLLGFGTSIIPSIFDFFKEKSKRAADLEELKLRADMQARGIELSIKQVQSQVEVEEAKAQAVQMASLYAQDASLKGSPWIESMRASLRPVITYVFFILFVAIKVCALISLLHVGASITDALPRLWDEETAGLFSAVIAFWFGNRAFDKSKSKK
jgi:hypothetical protein